MHWLAGLLDRLIALVQPWAEEYGAGGLMVVAFLDSSFISLPQVTDALLIGLTVAHPSRAPLYTATAAFGSVAGCYALFAVGRRGGQALLRRRFKERHIERGLGVVQRHGWLAVTVPSLLPPPAPFKLFVLLAGVAGLRTGTFIMAALVGRSVRYGAEAWLAYTYGEHAAAFVSDRLPTLLAIVAGVTAIGALGFLLWRRWAAARPPASSS